MGCGQLHSIENRPLVRNEVTAGLKGTVEIPGIDLQSDVITVRITGKVSEAATEVRWLTGTGG